jgi:hypothetical protein
MSEAQRFAFSYDTLGRSVMSPLGAGPKFSHIDIDPVSGTLEVRQGAFFQASVPLSSIIGASRYTSRTVSRGAHGWGGRWLINGSGEGLVSLNISPSAKGRVLGVPVTMRELILSMATPDEFIAALVDNPAH